jgi:hypothetical protein
MKKRDAVKRQELTGQTLVSLTNKTNWHRQTENTGLNMGDTWREWRQAQGQVKQIRV